MCLQGQEEYAVLGPLNAQEAREARADEKIRVEEMKAQATSNSKTAHPKNRRGHKSVKTVDGSKSAMRQVF